MRAVAPFNGPQSPVELFEGNNHTVQIQRKLAKEIRL